MEKISNGGVPLKLKRGLIVSCQLEPDDPVKDINFVVNMAVSAEVGGAVAIRTNGPYHIRRILDVVKIPIIGLVKDRRFETFITPTFEHAKEIINAGAHFVAIDCTRRKRPQPLEDIFKSIRKDFPEVGIIADIADIKDAEAVFHLKPDFFATTLSGYTDYTRYRKLPDIDLVKELVKEFDIPVIAEGGIWTPDEALEALKAGAYAVVVGTAITRPWLITKRFVSAMKTIINNEEVGLL
ncbi:MAG: N-acylglucosamine-6-phosphate 2-epimerase [Thermotoga sp.]|nr:N-acetylmannosamine-6-phosphate 2-epimerase [Candidatus Neomarinimicrobiota bacterium]RKX40345.1 MAG: N-acylglucosamine-6-phosphate 2-epimerase [Thermotogota bacterium]RKX53549.1 MAG: N-acylglucosamine-6-phosphate 2-epimerase [Thermotoga sp.]